MHLPCLSGSEDFVEDVDRDGVDFDGGDDVARTCDLLVRVPEQTRGERDTRGAFDESRRRPSIEMRRELVDVDAQLRELRRVVFYEGAQQSLVVADAERSAGLGREQERLRLTICGRELTADRCGREARQRNAALLSRPFRGVLPIQPIRFALLDGAGDQYRRGA